MLISSDRLNNLPVLSVQASGAIANLGDPIIDPDSLKILAFFVPNSPTGPLNEILDVKSIREYSHLGVVIDSEDEFIARDDVVKIRDVLALDFNLINLKVETRKGTNLGKVASFTVTSDDFRIQQLIVKRPLMKSFNDPELTIPRSEVVEVTDEKIIVKDEEKTIRERASKQDFIPNFVNPFRSEPGFAPAHTETPDDRDTE